MYKKITIIILALLCIITSFVFVGCGNVNKQKQEDENIDLPAKQEDENVVETNQDEEFVQYEGEKIELSFDEAIDQSYCVVTAKLTNINDKKTYREYDFLLIDTIIGDMSDAHFFVDEGYADYFVENSDTTYSTYDTEYEVGKEYILVLYKIASVYNERDQYMIAGDIFIELDNKGNISEYQRYHQPEKITFRNIEEFSSYVNTVTDNSKERLTYGMPFTRSSEIPEIVDASQYIVKAVVSEIEFVHPDSNRDTYICKVTETLRGSTQDEINIVLFKDTVSIGKEYLFMLNKDTEDSLIYALSSVNSVVDLEKEKTIVEEITSLVSE